MCEHRWKVRSPPPCTTRSFLRKDLTRDAYEWREVGTRRRNRDCNGPSKLWILSRQIIEQYVQGSKQLFDDIICKDSTSRYFLQTKYIHS
ncbi:hypothetical protein NPIL_134881 [Nephila pilipes]|uniref:Uncharacterized protein n=1 Tax=Nephila pilipes TaxID=299642 RepID=A0A8X6P521_NEPPI|nr:hypothetical protein NPIL_134881 [Nephila pilipes]